jgi:hypothetical protein
LLTTAPSAEANAQENVERPAAELYRLVAAAQFASSAIEPEPAKLISPSAIAWCRFRTINF